MCMRSSWAYKTGVTLQEFASSTKRRSFEEIFHPEEVFKKSVKEVFRSKCHPDASWWVIYVKLWQKIIIGFLYYLLFLMDDGWSLYNCWNFYSNLKIQFLLMKIPEKLRTRAFMQEVDKYIVLTSTIEILERVLRISWTKHDHGEKSVEMVSVHRRR